MASTVNSSKTADTIEMLFGVVGQVDPNNHVMHWVQIPMREWAMLGK